MTHPPTPIVWSNGKWYEFHYSLTSRQPYHEGQQINIYPTPVYPDTDEESIPSIDVQIRSTPVVIEPSGLGSPHRERNTQQGAPTYWTDSHTCNSTTMSTQTLVMTTEVISHTLVPGGDDEPPPSNQHQNPQHIRDTFDIALGQASGGPRGPEGPGDPFRGPNTSGGIPPAHLIPIQPAGDLKPVGIPPLLFHSDRTQADGFIRELWIYMMANQGVPGFKSPIRHIAIVLTFIKGP